MSESPKTDYETALRNGYIGSPAKGAEADASACAARTGTLFVRVGNASSSAVIRVDQLLSALCWRDGNGKSRMSINTASQNAEISFYFESESGASDAMKELWRSIELALAE